MISMLPIVAAIAFAAPPYAEPVPWALNFAVLGDFYMAADIDGDGFADLIRVSPKGDAFIDVAINGHGMKCVQPRRALSNWGRDCQAACVGELQGEPGAEILGIFNGDTLRLAHAYKDGSLKDEPAWVKLPERLDRPHLAMLRGRGILAWSEKSGKAFTITEKKALAARWVPSGVVWISSDISADDTVLASRTGANRLALICEGSNHEIFTAIERPAQNARGIEQDPDRRPPISQWVKDSLGKIPADITLQGGIDVNPLIAGELDDPFPSARQSWAAADMSNSGHADLIEFRSGTEPHTGSNVLVYRRAPKSTDAPHASVASGDSSRPLSTLYADSSGDGLLDDWKLNGFRGLDLKSIGCLPGQRDLICLISRYSNANKEMVESTFKNIVAYYLSLGWHLHPVFLDPLNEEDQKKPWWQLRDKFLPSKWRGVAHWMAVSPYGGGQADELSDGGVCGGNNWTLYATFIHEFGHQLGLNHEGFYSATGCPIYSSMMNYPYSYTFENDIKKIHYSDGSLKDFVLRETDLDETIPLPYEKVKFLAEAPYHYRLKPNGDTTLIDWNWNGIFGEKHVRADINYAYSTSAGRRDNVGKTNSAPWTFTLDKSAYVLYAQEGIKPDGKSDPSVGADKPGWLMLRRLIKPFEWAPAIKIADDGVTGDPVAIGFKGEIVVAYSSTRGVTVRWIKLSGDRVTGNEPILIDDTNSTPALGIYKGRLMLLEWSPKEGYVRYRSLVAAHKFADQAQLITSGAYAMPIKSTVPVSMAVDTFKDQVLIGTAEDQDEKVTSRWAIRRYKIINGQFKPAVANQQEPNAEREWIGGGSPRGRSRCVVLFDEHGVTGMKGRIVYYGQAMTSPQAPWACEYVAQSIADKSVNGGWMVKRYYDEWTQSRSAPAAAWFDGDILYAYRWADGSQGEGDNILHVGYNGTGIENVPMGDFDDIGFIRDFGMRNSILYLRE